MKKMRYRCSLKLLIAPERKKNFCPQPLPLGPSTLPQLCRSSIFFQVRLFWERNCPHSQQTYDFALVKSWSVFKSEIRNLQSSPSCVGSSYSEKSKATCKTSNAN